MSNLFLIYASKLKIKGKLTLFSDNLEDIHDSANVLSCCFLFLISIFTVRIYM